MACNKHDIRKQYLEKRRDLSKTKYWAYNDAILDKIKEINWDEFKCLHIFLPIRENNEVDTFEILSFFKDNFPALEIVVPRTNFQTKEMEIVEYNHEHTILKKNKYHIPEPIFGKIIDISKIDVVFVPLLAFDKAGNRVGYGGGFYDRFLEKTKTSIFKIGLSLFEPLDANLKNEKHDIKLNICITPSKKYVF